MKLQNASITRRAFTLVELLVVIAIIGLLSTVAVVATSSAGVNARNAKRKADLIQISRALEVYYSDNGSYPSTGNGWRGNCASYGGYPDSGAGAWIPNFQNYMATLPHDPHTGQKYNLFSYCQADANRACYLYRSDGTDYKALAFCTPEGSLASISADPLSDPGAEAGGSAYSVYTDGARTGW